ncbi:HD-GYP domain-containing protein [Vibrio sonorensis]|uniref:HD-GYP domain-containing protein n=1 Tax=Vibrio sonorensis TaxID=1004316 RepID=UPI0008DAF060|nr:HD domain-containing phosphohydrolase [Vibrio sonorensis]
MNDSLDSVSVDLRQVMLGIATALDAVGVDDIHHGHRVGYIAYQCAKRMGWDEELAQMAFGAGLIHDCGVSQETERRQLLSQLIPEDTLHHCRKGYELVEACKPISALSKAILYHHTHWIELSRVSGIDDLDKQLAALIFLSDRIDYLFVHSKPDQFGNITSRDKTAIIDELISRSGLVFEPNMVVHMCELITTDDFWFSMEANHIESLVARLPEVRFFDSHTGLDQTIEMAELLAKIIDAKSPFTFQHSKHVAELSAFFGQALGYSEKMQRMLYLSGLLHDIGKIKTPSSVLHKPSSLNEEEYACIKRHSTDTRFALQGMIRSKQVVSWAANHHERLDGSGYPLGKVAKELDKPSRLIAVADVFQALTQSRPYRDGLSLEDTMTILHQQANQGLLDAQVVECLERNKQVCYQISIGEIGFFQTSNS